MQSYSLPTKCNGNLNSKQKWTSIFKFSNIIGVLNYTHIEMNKPTTFGDCYTNRKGYTSISIHVTCDADEKITNLSANWPSCTLDNRIWRCSNVNKVLANLKGAASLLVNGGYRLSPWILPSFESVPNRDQEKF